MRLLMFFDPPTFPWWSPGMLWDSVMCMRTLKALLLRVCACIKVGVGLIMLTKLSSRPIQPKLSVRVGVRVYLHVCVCVCVCV